MFLKNKNIIFQIRRSIVTDYAALKTSVILGILSIAFRVMGIQCFLNFGIFAIFLLGIWDIFQNT